MNELAQGLLILAKYNSGSTMEIDLYQIRIYSDKSETEADKIALKQLSFVWFESEYCWRFFDKNMYL